MHWICKSAKVKETEHAEMLGAAIGWGGIPPQSFPEEASYPNGDRNQQSFAASGQTDIDAGYSAAYGGKQKGSQNKETTDWADAGNGNYHAIVDKLGLSYQKLKKQHKGLIY